MTKNHTSSSRDKVASEAALLLYSGEEKEYKQAKLRAAKVLGVRFLPSNAEVAEALDRVAEEREGDERRKTLIAMREEALQIMKRLKDHCPKLTGSVWRGTARRGSDIDIVVFSDTPEAVLRKLDSSVHKNIRTEWQSVTKHGEEIRTLHVYFALVSGYEVELIVRGIERLGETAKCEIYGDVQTGLDIRQLEHILKTAPALKFTPE